MASPLDQFKIISYFPLGFGNYQISFTNSALAMLIGSVLQISLLWLLPKRFSVFKGIGELYYEFISGLVLSCAGKKAGFLIPFISAIFSTIFFGNIIGLVPSIFTFTSHLIPNFVLAVIVLLTVVLIGLYRNGFESNWVKVKRSWAVSLKIACSKRNYFILFIRLSYLELEPLASVLPMLIPSVDKTERKVVFLFM